MKILNRISIDENGQPRVDQNGQPITTQVRVPDNYNVSATPYKDPQGNMVRDQMSEEDTGLGMAKRAGVDVATQQLPRVALGALAGLGSGRGQPGTMAAGMGFNALSSAANAGANALNRLMPQSKLAAFASGGLATAGQQAATAFASNARRGGIKAGLASAGLAGLEGLIRGGVNMIPGGESFGNAIPSVLGGIAQGIGSGDWGAVARGVGQGAMNVLSSDTFGEDMGKIFSPSEASEYGGGTYGQAEGLSDESISDLKPSEDEPETQGFTPDELNTWRGMSAADKQQYRTVQFQNNPPPAPPAPDPQRAAQEAAQRDQAQRAAATAQARIARRAAIAAAGGGGAVRGAEAAAEIGAGRRVGAMAALLGGAPGAAPAPAAVPAPPAAPAAAPGLLVPGRAAALNLFGAAPPPAAPPAMAAAPAAPPAMAAAPGVPPAMAAAPDADPGIIARAMDRVPGIAPAGRPDPLAPGAATQAGMAARAAEPRPPDLPAYNPQVRGEGFDATPEAQLRPFQPMRMPPDAAAAAMAAMPEAVAQPAPPVEPLPVNVQSEMAGRRLARASNVGEPRNPIGLPNYEGDLNDLNNELLLQAGGNPEALRLGGLQPMDERGADLLAMQERNQEAAREGAREAMTDEQRATFAPVPPFEPAQPGAEGEAQRIQPEPQMDLPGSYGAGRSLQGENVRSISVKPFSDILNEQAAKPPVVQQQQQPPQAAPGVVPPPQAQPPAAAAPTRVNAETNPSAVPPTTEPAVPVMPKYNPPAEEVKQPPVRSEMGVDAMDIPQVEQPSEPVFEQEEPPTIPRKTPVREIYEEGLRQADNPFYEQGVEPAEPNVVETPEKLRKAKIDELTRLLGNPKVKARGEARRLYRGLTEEDLSRRGVKPELDERRPAPFKAQELEAPLEKPVEPARRTFPELPADYKPEPARTMRRRPTREEFMGSSKTWPKPNEYKEPFQPGEPPAFTEPPATYQEAMESGYKIPTQAGVFPLKESFKDVSPDEIMHYMPDVMRLLDQGMITGVQGRKIKEVRKMLNTWKNEYRRHGSTKVGIPPEVQGVFHKFVNEEILGSPRNEEAYERWRQTQPSREEALAKWRQEQQAAEAAWYKDHPEHLDYDEYDRQEEALKKQWEAERPAGDEMYERAMAKWEREQAEAQRQWYEREKARRKALLGNEYEMPEDQQRLIAEDQAKYQTELGKYNERLKALDEIETMRGNPEMNAQRQQWRKAVKDAQERETTQSIAARNAFIRGELPSHVRTMGDYIKQGYLDKPIDQMTDEELQQQTAQMQQLQDMELGGGRSLSDLGLGARRPTQTASRAPVQTFAGHPYINQQYNEAPTKSVFAIQGEKEYKTKELIKGNDGSMYVKTPLGALKVGNKDKKDMPESYMESLSRIRSALASYERDKDPRMLAYAKTFYDALPDIEKGIFEKNKYSEGTRQDRLFQLMDTLTGEKKTKGLKKKARDILTKREQYGLDDKEIGTIYRLYRSQKAALDQSRFGSPSIKSQQAEAGRETAERRRKHREIAPKDLANLKSRRAIARLAENAAKSQEDTESRQRLQYDREYFKRRGMLAGLERTKRGARRDTLKVGDKGAYTQNNQLPGISADWSGQTNMPYFKPSQNVRQYEMSKLSELAKKFAQQQQKRRWEI